MREAKLLAGVSSSKPLLLAKTIHTKMAYTGLYIMATQGTTSMSTNEYSDNIRICMCFLHSKMANLNIC